MTDKELDRVEVIKALLDKRIPLSSGASRLGLSNRQTIRLKN